MDGPVLFPMAEVGAGRGLLSGGCKWMDQYCSPWRRLERGEGYYLVVVSGWTSIVPHGGGWSGARVTIW